MSDYKMADHIAEKLLRDFKETRDSGLIKDLSPNDTLKFLSINLYLQEKLGKYIDMIDLCESFITTEEIMQRCNPFSLFYILEDTRFNQNL